MTAPIKADDYVRLKILPANCRPTPILVTKVLANGMINLLGWSGDFAAHLFVKADPPVKKKGNYIVNSLRGRKQEICTMRTDAKRRTETKLCILAMVARS